MTRAASNPINAPRRPRAGFTLTELLVAVAAVALLTVGVGQIFKSVTKLTSTGQAVAEVDSLARTLETQLRADFDAFRRVPADESFLVIRMREEGDLDRNDQTDSDEIRSGLYLTPEDREADRRDGIQPYGQVSPGGAVLRSKAVTRRLDEIAFIGLAPADQPYRSAQVVQTPGQSAAQPTARKARIYWGHALRPRIEPDAATHSNTTTGQIIPDRQYVPDGDFGQNPLDTSANNFTPTYPNSNYNAFTTTGRNQYASRWILARQPLLLYGGDAAGTATQNEAPLGIDMEYAPYIRDLEGTPNARFGLPTTPASFSDPNPGFPNPRLIFQGRVDVCAQNADDVRRWLEGEAEDPDAAGVRTPPYAGAFSSGFYANQGNGGVNAPLWLRAGPNTNAPGTTIDANLIGLRSAIAGVLARPLADDVPPKIDRAPLNASAALLHNGETPEDALMDLHAIISTRCSNFEIAWSDGTRARQEIDFDNDGNPDYRSGDLIWFDVSPVPGAGNEPTRMTYDAWLRGAGALSGQQNKIDPLPGYTPDTPRVEVLSGPHFLSGGNVPPTALLNRATGGNGGSGEYDVAITGGDGRTPNPSEALAIWGFRLPTGDGGFGAAWPKPKFIRVRVTLHDAQFRIPGGKQYEFVFPLTQGPAL